MSNTMTTLTSDEFVYTNVTPRLCGLSFHLSHVPVVPATIVACIKITYWLAGPARTTYINNTLLSQRPDWTFFQEHDFFEDVTLNYATGLLTLKMSEKYSLCSLTMHISYEHTMEFLNRDQPVKVRPYRFIDDSWES